jgi:hypothetical protein
MQGIAGPEMLLTLAALRDYVIVQLIANSGTATPPNSLIFWWPIRLKAATAAESQGGPWGINVAIEAQAQE